MVESVVVNVGLCENDSDKDDIIFENKGYNEWMYSEDEIAESEDELATRLN